MLDQHHGGVGDVDAHLYYGSGDENIHLAVAECAHRALALCGGESSVEQRDPPPREYSEALLLVDHNESELRENRRLLQKRVRSDHEQRLSGRHALRGLSAVVGVEASSDE